MQAVRVKVSAAEHVKERTLRKTPLRLVTFLAGTRDPAIFAQLSEHGWSRAHYEEGRAHLEALTGYDADCIELPRDDGSSAIAACAALASGAVVRARAILELTCPAQHAFLFADWEAGHGAAVTSSVGALVDRIGALREGAGREATRDADAVALRVLREMGLGEDVTSAITLQIARAMDHGAAASPAQTSRREAKKEERVVLLRRSYAWLAAWSIVARSVVTRRDQLIRLGLARPKSPVARRAA